MVAASQRVADLFLLSTSQGVGGGGGFYIDRNGPEEEVGVEKKRHTVTRICGLVCAAAGRFEYLLSDDECQQTCGRHPAGR